MVKPVYPLQLRCGGYNNIIIPSNPGDIYCSIEKKIKNVDLNKNLSVHDIKLQTAIYTWFFAIIYFAYFFLSRLKKY